MTAVLPVAVPAATGARPPAVGRPGDDDFAAHLADALGDRQAPAPRLDDARRPASGRRDDDQRAAVAADRSAGTRTSDARSTQRGRHVATTARPSTRQPDGRVADERVERSPEQEVGRDQDGAPAPAPVSATGVAPVAGALALLGGPLGLAGTAAAGAPAGDEPGELGGTAEPDAVGTVAAIGTPQPAGPAGFADPLEAAGGPPTGAAAAGSPPSLAAVVPERPASAPPGSATRQPGIPTSAEQPRTAPTSQTPDPAVERTPARAAQTTPADAQPVGVTAGQRPDAPPSLLGSVAGAAQAHPAAAAAVPVIAPQGSPDPVPSAPGTASSAAPAPQPGDPASLARQLGARLASVGTLGNGHHVLTVPVDPEHLGPVRIVAHITPDSVRLHLAGVSPESHGALTGALDDLRRDLAQHGLRAEVDVDAGAGSGGRPGDPDASRSGGSGAPGGRAPGRSPSSAQGSAPPAASARGGPPPAPARAGHLDLVV